mgnify:CR=1 FL=1
MYAMVKWMNVTDVDTIEDGVSFEEFIESAAMFFSQTHNDEGLKYIFELYDPEKRGYLDKFRMMQIF